MRDLAREDFEILENGVLQTISQFAVQDHERLSASWSPPAADSGTEPPLARTFVIVLGRGRLQGPSKGFDALFEFLDRRVSSSDRVALAAYNRITDLTTDRAAIRRLLERCRDANTRLEARLDHWFRGLTAQFSRGQNPPRLQAEIDALFEGQGLPRTRSLTLLPVEAEGELARRRQEFLEAIGRNEDDSRRGLVYETAAVQDFERLQAAIEHLRYLDGEKHLIMLSPEGLLVANAHLPDHIARLAANARVSLSFIHTGGIATSWMHRGRMVTFEGPSWNHLWANANSRLMADETGGLTSIYTYAAPALDRIERATRFTYVLGFYPQNPDLDGKYRRIAVRVHRPDVRVFYRRGYYARPEPEFPDRRTYLTDSRITSAAGYRGEVSDIPVTLTAAIQDGSKDAIQVLVTVRLAPGSIPFEESDGRFTTSLDVALFAGTGGEKQVGELQKRVDLSLLPENHARVMANGIEFSGTIEATERPRYVKAVIYDYSTDRLGSAVVELAGR